MSAFLLSAGAACRTPPQVNVCRHGKPVPVELDSWKPEKDTEPDPVRGCPPDACASSALVAFEPEKPIAGFADTDGSAFMQFPFAGRPPLNKAPWMGFAASCRRLAGYTDRGPAGFRLFHSNVYSFPAPRDPQGEGLLLDPWLADGGPPLGHERSLSWAGSVLIYNTPGETVDGRESPPKLTALGLEDSKTEPQRLFVRSNVSAIARPFSGEAVTLPGAGKILVWRAEDPNDAVGALLKPVRPRSIPLFIGVAGDQDGLEATPPIATGLQTLCGGVWGFDLWGADLSKEDLSKKMVLMYTACDGAGVRSIGFQRLLDGSPDGSPSAPVSLATVFDPIRRQLELSQKADFERFVEEARIRFLDNENLLLASTTKEMFYLIKIPFDSKTLALGKITQWRMLPGVSIAPGDRQFPVFVNPAGNEIVARLFYQGPGPRAGRFNGDLSPLGFDLADRLSLGGFWGDT